MFPCEFKEQADQPTLSIRFRSPVQDLPQHFGRIYGAISQYLAALGEHHAGAPFAAYYNMDMQNLDVEAGIPVSKPLSGKGEIQASRIPGGTFAVCHYTGPYEGTGPAYEELMQFAKGNGYALGNVCYEWYLNGPETPLKDLKTDLVCPVIRQPENAGA